VVFSHLPDVRLNRLDSKLWAELPDPTESVDGAIVYTAVRLASPHLREVECKRESTQSWFGHQFMK